LKLKVFKDIIRHFRDLDLGLDLNGILLDFQWNKWLLNKRLVKLTLKGFLIFVWSDSDMILEKINIIHSNKLFKVTQQRNSEFLYFNSAQRLPVLLL